MSVQENNTDRVKRRRSVSRTRRVSGSSKKLRTRSREVRRPLVSEDPGAEVISETTCEVAIASEPESSGMIVMPKEEPVSIADDRSIRPVSTASFTEPRQNLTIENSHQKISTLDFKRIASKMLRNVWFWRSVGLTSLLVAAIVLLAYSLDFMISFATFGKAVSYFPWSWNVAYTSLPPVANLFLAGFELSSLGLIIAFLVLRLLFIPKFKTSFFKMK
jgi:hypothetical protein